MRQAVRSERDTAVPSYIWNSIGGLLNAFQSVVVLMVITRVCGLTAAGIYSIAYATGNLFLYLGNYGVRNYQVSDLQEQYRFRDYLHHRLFTVGLMLLLSVLFCAYHLWNGSYSGEKTAVVFAMCVLKCEDCLEEVFEGRLHQKGHLDLAGKMMTVRILVSIGGMIGVLICTRNLLLSTLASIVLAFVSFAAMAFLYRNEISEASVTENAGRGLGANPGEKHGPLRLAEDAQRDQNDAGTAGRQRTGHRHPAAELMRACFPVCAANFLSFYLINAPKYAIDTAMDETAQAKYNFIAMPVFVIQLLTMFIYQPVMVRMTQRWQENSPEGKWTGRKSFLRDFFQVTGWLLAISAVVLAGAWLLGIPVLSLLYATDLTDLKEELMIILIGSIFLAMNGFYCAVLTLMRLQNRIPAVYLIGTVLSLLLTPRMVRADGIRGAVTAFSWIMVLVCLLLTLQFLQGIRHRSRVA